MAISVGTVTSGSQTGTGSSLTFSATVAAGESLNVGVLARYGSAGFVTGVTFNGVAMTKIDESGTNFCASAWELRSPTPATANVVVTFSTSIDRPKLAIAVPVGATNETYVEKSAKGGANATSITTSLTTAYDNELIVSFVLQEDDANNKTISVNDSSTQQVNTQVSGTFGLTGGASTKAIATAGANNVSWSSTGSAQWEHIAIAIKERPTDVKNSSLATNLVAYWKLDEASGTRVDSHGSNDLTDNNTVTSATGVINDGAYFTAANTEYLSRADGGAGGDLDPTGDYSAWFWFDRATTGSGEQFLYGKDRLSGAGDNRAYSAYLNSSNQLEVFYRDGSGNNTGWQSTSTTIGTDGNLHFLLITVDVSDTTSGIKCYLDGSTTPLAGSYYATSATSIRDTALAFHLGVASDGATYKYNGLLDEFGFCKGRILSATDGVDLFNNADGLIYEDTTPVSTHLRAPAINSTGSFVIM